MCGLREMWRLKDMVQILLTLFNLGNSIVDILEKAVRLFLNEDSTSGDFPHPEWCVELIMDLALRFNQSFLTD